MTKFTLKHQVLRVGRSATPRIMASLALGVLCLATSLGCRTRIADFTAISTKNIYSKGIDITALPKAEGIEGSDIGFLGIGAEIEDAVEKAMEKGQGNLMIDCAVYTWEVPFFFGYQVRGTVVKVPYTSDRTSSQQSGP